MTYTLEKRRLSFQCLEFYTEDTNSIFDSYKDYLLPKLAKKTQHLLTSKRADSVLDNQISKIRISF